MGRFKVRIWAIVLAALLGAIAAPAANAHQGHAHAGKYSFKFRLSTMQALSIHMALLLAEIRGEATLTPERRQAHGAAVQALSSLLVDLFQDETWRRSRSKREIWTDWEGFSKRARAFEARAKDLSRAARTGDPAQITAKLDLTAAACTGCHKAYRKPKR